MLGWFLASELSPLTLLIGRVVACSVEGAVVLDPTCHFKK